jgi:hypothetical protein
MGFPGETLCEPDVYNIALAVLNPCHLILPTRLQQRLN